ncbi:MAG: c-type cytochrome [Deltaproteobacteria bacterium]|nr:c-type cytochrome [Deltaproteobacteria bacterium]
MKGTIFGLLVAGLFLTLIAMGCAQGEAPKASPVGGGNTSAPAATTAAAPAAAAAVSEAAITEAKNLFATRCMPCHGAAGQGDGPASKGLTPQPRTFHDADWQKGVTDEHIEKIIQYGGAAVGKSPMMPPNPDLVAKKEVVAGLRQHIRELGK